MIYNAHTDTHAQSQEEAEYTTWLQTRLAQTIRQLDSGAMKSYPTHTAKAILDSRLEARRSAMLVAA